MHPRSTASRLSASRRLHQDDARSGFLGPKTVNCSSETAAKPRLYQQSSEVVRRLPEAVQAIYSGKVWRNACAAAPEQPEQTALRVGYAFNIPTAADQTTKYAPLPKRLHALMRSVLTDLADRIMLDFFEVPSDESQTAFLRIGVSLEAGDYGASASVGNDWRPFIVFNPKYIAAGYESFVEGGGRHEMLHTLGMCHPFDGCTTDVRLPVGDFVDNHMTTTMSYTDACYVNATFSGFGPLDLSALVAGFGARASGQRLSNLTLTNATGITGLIDTQGGERTLRVRSSLPVVLSLAVDGSAASFVDQARVQLAPLSTLTRADLRGSVGGFLIGNGANNTLFGSDFDDIIDSRLGHAVVQTGDGHDTLVVRTGAGQIDVLDFSPGSDRLAATFDANFELQREALADGGEQVSLRFAGGEHVRLTTPVGERFEPGRDLLRQDPVPELTACRSAKTIFSALPPSSTPRALPPSPLTLRQAPPPAVGSSPTERYVPPVSFRRPLAPILFSLAFCLVGVIGIVVLGLKLQRWTKQRRERMAPALPVARAGLGRATL